MEDDQFFHDRPDHPEVFLFRLVLSSVDDRDGGLVRLHIVAREDLFLKRLIQGLQQFYRLLEPSVQRAFRKAFQPEMPVLPYLTVERDVVFILLKQYLGKQAGISDALVNRHQRHGGNLHSFLSSRRKHGAVLECIFGTDDFLDVKHPRLVFDDFCYLFAYSTV